MTRSIIRRVNWTCTIEPASPDPIYTFVCLTCGAAGQAETDFERARDFAFTHVGSNPGHTGYREDVVRFWRMHGEDVAQPCPHCRGRGAHVLPTSSAETECWQCEGTGVQQEPEQPPPAQPSAPTHEYGAPALPVVLGPADAGAPTREEW